MVQEGAPRATAKSESQQAAEVRLQREDADLWGREHQTSGRPQEPVRQSSRSPGAHLPTDNRKQERSVPQRYQQGGQQNASGRAEKILDSSIQPERECWNYNTDRGCRFGDNCRFAHWEPEVPLQRPAGRQYAPAGQGVLQGGRQGRSSHPEFNRQGMRRAEGVRFVGKITDEREWPDEEGNEEGNDEGNEEGDEDEGEDEGDVQGLYDCEMQWCPQ